MNDASQYTDMNLALAASEAAEDVVRYESLIIKTLSLEKKNETERRFQQTKMLVDCASELAASLQTGTIGSPVKRKVRFYPPKNHSLLIQFPTRVSSPESTSISKEEEKERHDSFILLFDSYVR